MRIGSKWSALSSILFILLGISMIIWPLNATALLYNTLGVLVLIYGSVKIIDYFKSGEAQGAFQFDVVLGVVAAVLGLLLLFATQLFVTILPILCGIFLIVEGVLKVRPMLDLRAAGYPHWWYALLSALLVLACGVVLVINPFAGASIAAIIIGATLVFDGISNIFMFGIFRKRNKQAAVIIDKED